MAREGWLYFAATLDLFSRRVVGWSFGTENDTALVLGALDMAIQTRRPEPGLIFHSDRGSTYASSAFRAELDRHGLIASMSRKGDCWDNAVAESFFASLKGEWLLERGYETIAEAKADLFRYVEEFYNRERLHSTLGYLSPAEFEATTVHV
ncbi:MAG: IS3 family transposase [Candidatus Eisenbacteria bacterium]